MKRFLVTLGLGAVLLSPNAAHSKLLTSDEIAALLPTIVAMGEQTRQIFSAAGPTTYTDRGRDTFGNWRVQNDKYCSQWPPAGGWSCYAVDYDEATQTLIWIDGGGHRTVNTVVPKE